jgi:hypothetical protein
LYKKPDWTLALPSLPSSTSQASFDPPRTSTPLPRAGFSSPFLTRVAAHVLPSLLPHLRPTARTFLIATSPKDRSRHRLPWRPSSPLPLQLPRSARLVRRWRGIMCMRSDSSSHPLVVLMARTLHDAFPFFPSFRILLSHTPPHCARLPHRHLLKG